MDPKVISSDEKKNEGNDYILHFLASLYSMTSCIMMDYTNEREIQDCENIIKSFLSDLHKLDKWMRTKTCDTIEERRKPIWLSKYKFQSLINLLSTIRKFGPLRIIGKDRCRERVT